MNNADLLIARSQAITRIIDLVKGDEPPPDSEITAKLIYNSVVSACTECAAAAFDVGFAMGSQEGEKP